MSESTESVESPTRIVRPRSRSRLWQFSVRELLLLTAIAGLSLTVWRLASGRFEPTSFLTKYQLAKALEEAQEELVGAATVQMAETAQVVDGHADSDNVGLKFVYLCRFREKVPPPAALLDALQSRLKAQLADEGCRVVDEGQSPIVALPGFPNSGFFINYGQGRTRGLVNVDAVARENELEIYILIHEFRER